MSVWLSIGWFGLGASGGQFPQLRLGVVAVGCCWGGIGVRVNAFIEEVKRLLRLWGGE